MEAYLEEYAARFWIAKQPCKLSWKRYLGKLDIDLTINGTTKDFRVTPFEATILFHFQVSFGRHSTKVSSFHQLKSHGFISANPHACNEHLNASGEDMVYPTSDSLESLRRSARRRS